MHCCGFLVCAFAVWWSVVGRRGEFLRLKLERGFKLRFKSVLDWLTRNAGFSRPRSESKKSMAPLPRTPINVHGVLVFKITLAPIPRPKKHSTLTPKDGSAKADGCCGCCGQGFRFQSCAGFCGVGAGAFAACCVLLYLCIRGLAKAGLLPGWLLPGSAASDGSDEESELPSGDDEGRRRGSELGGSLDDDDEIPLGSFAPPALPREARGSGAIGLPRTASSSRRGSRRGGAVFATNIEGPGEMRRPGAAAAGAATGDEEHGDFPSSHRCCARLRSFIPRGQFLGGSSSGAIGAFSASSVEGPAAGTASRKRGNGDSVATQRTLYEGDDDAHHQRARAKTSGIGPSAGGSGLPSALYAPAAARVGGKAGPRQSPSDIRS